MVQFIFGWFRKYRSKPSSSRSRSSGSRSSSGSSGRSSRGSPAHERVIPPEPIQQNVEGDHPESFSGPPLQAHNLARASKRVAKLEWDSTLANEAEIYAHTLANTGMFEPSGIEFYGENIYVTNHEAEFDAAVQHWLDEEKKYNGESIGEGNIADWQNFSQCMWHTTTHVGMGKATASDGKTYVVARYAPKGNVHGGKPFVV